MFSLGEVYGRMNKALLYTSLQSDGLYIFENERLFKVGKAKYRIAPIKYTLNIIYMHMYINVIIIKIKILNNALIPWVFFSSVLVTAPLSQAFVTTVMHYY